MRTKKQALAIANKANQLNGKEFEKYLLKQKFVFFTTGKLYVPTIREENGFIILNYWGNGNPIDVLIMFNA